MVDRSDIREQVRQWYADVEIRDTHEVHEFAKAAIVRAVRP